MQVVPGQRMVSDFDGEAFTGLPCIASPQSITLFVFGARTNPDRPETFSYCGFFARDFIPSGKWHCNCTAFGRYATKGKTKEEDLALEQDLLADERRLLNI